MSQTLYLKVTDRGLVLNLEDEVAKKTYQRTRRCESCPYRNLSQPEAMKLRANLLGPHSCHETRLVRCAGNQLQTLDIDESWKLAEGWVTINSRISKPTIKLHPWNPNLDAEANYLAYLSQVSTLQEMDNVEG